MSNITVIDIDDETFYDELTIKKPELKYHFTMKSNKGYHICFKYNEYLSTTTNINNLKGIDCRNGLIIAPTTKYKLLNGKI